MERKNWTGTVAGQPGQYSGDRTVGTSQPRQVGLKIRLNSSDWTDRDRDSKDRAFRTGQPGQDRQDSQDMTVGTGELMGRRETGS